APRTISVEVSDGAGGISDDATLVARIVDLNDAPVLNSSLSPTLVTNAEDVLTPTSTLVGSLLTGAVTDADGPGALQGIAVIGAPTTNGNWQFSTDGGT